MTQTVATQLRRTVMEIDRQLLELLMASPSPSPDDVKSIALLEQARQAAFRLMMEAEAAEGEQTRGV